MRSLGYLIIILTIIIVYTVIQKVKGLIKKRRVKEYKAAKKAEKEEEVREAKRKENERELNYEKVRERLRLEEENYVVNGKNKESEYYKEMEEFMNSEEFKTLEEEGFEVVEEIEEFDLDKYLEEGISDYEGEKVIYPEKVIFEGKYAWAKKGIRNMANNLLMYEKEAKKIVQKLNKGEICEEDLGEYDREVLEYYNIEESLAEIREFYSRYNVGIDYDRFKSLDLGRFIIRFM